MRTQDFFWLDPLQFYKLHKNSSTGPEFTAVLGLSWPDPLMASTELLRAQRWALTRYLVFITLFGVDWFLCQFDRIFLKERDGGRAAEAFRRNSMQLEAKLRWRLGGRCGGGVGVWWQRSKNTYSSVWEIMENSELDTKTQMKTISRKWIRLC